MFFSIGTLVLMAVIAIAVVWLAYDLGLTSGQAEGYMLAQDEMNNEAFIKAKESYFYPNHE